MAQLEFALFFTFDQAQAASEGFLRTANNSGDFKIHKGYCTAGFRELLFNVRSLVVEVLSFVHPLYFLETTGMDPVLCFLTLCRGQELLVAEECCAQYDWQSGQTLRFDEVS